VKCFYRSCLAVMISTSISFADFQINTHTSGNQTIPALAADANGNFVVVWSSYDQNGTSNDIFARRFDRNTSALGGEFQVNTKTTGNQTSPAIAMNPAGNFVVAWHGPDPNGESEEDIFARRFDPNCLPLRDEFRVNTITADSQLSPAVAMNNDGNFVVVWESNSVPQPGKKAICGQLYDHTGSAVGLEFVVNDANEQPVCRHPAAVMQDNGKFIVVWVRESTKKSIWVRHFDTNGTAPYLPKKVSDSNFSSLTRPGIAIDANGNYAIVWDGHLSSSLEDDVYLKRYHYSHAPLHSQFRVNTSTTGAQSDPAIAMAGDGRFIVVWQNDTDSEITKKDIFGQRFPAQGEYIGNPLLTGDEFRINTYTVDDQKYPAVVMDDSAAFITAWQSNEQDNSGFGIFGKIGPIIGSADLTGDGFINFADYRFLAAEWLKQSNPLTADLVDDNKIDYKDLFAFCDQWLTYCYDCTQADLHSDNKIDFKDYVIFANNWLKQGPKLAGDTTGNGTVDFLDLIALTSHWTRSCQ